MMGNLLIGEEPFLKESTRATTTAVSVVIPALNEEEAIAGTVSAIPVKKLNDMGYEVQVIVVDNGSTDRTAEIARKVGADVIHERRRGYGRAYKTGFSHARGDIIATADADMSYPIEAIPEMIHLLEMENLDFITTNRYAFGMDGAMSRLHKAGNYVLNATTKLLYQMDIRDSQSGMWIFRREILDRIALRANGMAFSQELKIEACRHPGCRWKEVPIQYRKRVGVEKIRSWQDGFSNLLHLVNKRFTRVSRNVKVSSLFQKE